MTIRARSYHIRGTYGYRITVEWPADGNARVLIHFKHLDSNDSYGTYVTRAGATRFIRLLRQFLRECGPQSKGRRKEIANPPTGRAKGKICTH